MTVRDIEMSGAVWRKSSYSSGNGGQCVEVALNLPGTVAVRDSKDPGGTTLVFAAATWRSFTSLASRNTVPPTAAVRAEGMASFTCP